MKHVIVIETADHLPFSQNGQDFLTELVETYTDKHVGFCVLVAAFNVQNVVAAIHVLFGAPGSGGVA